MRLVSKPEIVTSAVDPGVMPATAKLTYPKGNCTPSGSATPGVAATDAVMLLPTGELTRKFAPVVGLWRATTFGKLLLATTWTLGENSEVLFDGSVAVALMNWPTAITGEKWLTKSAVPAISVVTEIEPR